ELYFNITILVHKLLLSHFSLSSFIQYSYRALHTPSSVSNSPHILIISLIITPFSVIGLKLQSLLNNTSLLLNSTTKLLSVVANTLIVFHLPVAGSSTSNRVPAAYTFAGFSI